MPQRRSGGVPDVDRAVLGSIGEILTPDLVEDIIAKVRGLLAPDHQATQMDRVLEKIEAVDRQAANLADAIAIGGDVPALVARLQKVEQRRVELLRKRSVRGRAEEILQIDWRAAERQARRLLAEWRGLLGRHTVEARQVLRELLDGPLRFTPILEETRRGYQFEGAVRIEGLM